MSRILVTGATGFVGRALVAAFAANGQAVCAAVRRPPPFDFPAGVDIFQHGDLGEPVDWRPALDGIDAVIHLAGIAHIGRGVSPKRYDSVNVLATVQLAQAAAAAKVERFVFVSSIRAQSGPCSDHVLNEKDAAAPTDDYGRSKLAAEAAVGVAGAPFTVLRPVVLYGSGVKGNVALLARAAASPWPLPLASFVNRRSLLGIDNFISAVSFVLASPAARGETYIVADPGEAPRLCDVIAALRVAQGRRPLLLPVPRSFVEAPLRLMGRGELWQRFGGDLQADPGKLIGAGWQPLHDTVAGLAAMVRGGAPEHSRPQPAAADFGLR